MSEYKDKLDKLKKTPVRVESVDPNAIYKQLEDLYGKFSESNQLNKEFLADVSKIVAAYAEEVAKGVRVTNLEEIKIEPTFNTPDVVVPEVKVPTINVPEPTIIKETSLSDKYRPADIIEDGSTKYYGYLSNAGEWFIMRETGNGDHIKYRYSSGKSGFKKAINKRARLTYKYYDEVEL